jgi:hypothetical protein
LIRTGGVSNSLSFSPRQVDQRLCTGFIRTTHLSPWIRGTTPNLATWTLCWSEFSNDVEVSLCVFCSLLHTAAFLSLYLSYVPTSDLRRHSGGSKNAIPTMLPPRSRSFGDGEERRQPRYNLIFLFYPSLRCCDAQMRARKSERSQ